MKEKWCRKTSCRHKPNLHQNLGPCWPCWPWRDLMGKMQMVEGEVSMLEKQRLLGGREGWSSEDGGSKVGSA